MSTGCSHLAQIGDFHPSDSRCGECVALGDRWVHLRQCLVCGHVACCDASKNQHARRHFEATAHPVMRTAEPMERWGWCYADEVILRSELAPGPPLEPGGSTSPLRPPVESESRR